MVAITNEQAWEDMRRKDYMDGMSPADRRALGRAGRIEVPWTDAYTLRRIADLLRGYAAMLDNYSRRQDMEERSIIFAVKLETAMLNQRIRELHGIDKFNRNGSTKNEDVDKQ